MNSYRVKAGSVVSIYHLALIQGAAVDMKRYLTPIDHTQLHLYQLPKMQGKCDWIILLLNSSVEILLSVVPDISMENNLFF